MAQQSAVAAALKTGGDAAAAEAPKVAPVAKPEVTKPKADPAPAAVEAKKPEPITALLMSQWKARESGVFFNTHEVVPNAGTPIAHLLRPEFWGNVSQRFKPGDTILAFPRDGAWYGEFLVWDAGMNWANVSSKGMAEKPEFAAMEGVSSDFEIGRDPMDGWVIKRRSTGARVKSNFPNAEEARKWILDHQRALRA